MADVETGQNGLKEKIKLLEELVQVIDDASLSEYIRGCAVCESALRKLLGAWR